MKRGDVVSRLRTAYNFLLKNDFVLLEIDANERSLTHKLAEYLQFEFPDWNVDCEYNRKGGVPKRLTGRDEFVSTFDTDGGTVYPDIIIHHRMTRENLVVIEAKKTSTTKLSTDPVKLEDYKLEHGYSFAFAVVFPVGDMAINASSLKDIVEVKV